MMPCENKILSSWKLWGKALGMGKKGRERVGQVLGMRCGKLCYRHRVFSVFNEKTMCCRRYKKEPLNATVFLLFFKKNKT